MRIADARHRSLARQLDHHFGFLAVELQRHGQLRHAGRFQQRGLDAAVRRFGVQYVVSLLRPLRPHLSAAHIAQRDRAIGWVERRFERLVALGDHRRESAALRQIDLAHAASARSSAQAVSVPCPVRRGRMAALSGGITNRDCTCRQSLVPRTSRPP